MDPPPPYKVSASMTRSRTSRGNVEEMAEMMLRSSVSRNATTTSSSSSNSQPDTAPVAAATTSTPVTATAAAAPVSPSPVPAYPTVEPPPPTSPIRPSSASSSATNTSDRRRSSIPAPQYLPFMGTPFVKNKKSSDSAERLRRVEQENNELRAQIHKQQSLNEQLKRDAHRSSYVSNKEAKQRMAQLKDESRLAVAEVTTSRQPMSNQAMFKSACSTDLLFLIDCTYSMDRSIETVKTNVKKIVNDISKAFYNEAKIRVAVVGYRDHDSKNKLEVLDFTTSTDSVISFLDKLKAVDGDDMPEDVLGGIHKALNMSWEQSNRCMVHICDAPPHGRIFQDEPYKRDTFPEAGSEPHGLTYEPLFQLMTRMSINYVFLPISKLTDRMAYMFARVYLEASADVKLNLQNKHYDAFSRLVNQRGQNGLDASSKRTAQGKLMFVVAEMGTVYTYLRNLVVKSVLSSASRTATRTSEARGATTQARAITAASSLAPIDETDFENEKPQWDISTWFDEVIPMEGFSPDVIVHSKNTLDNWMQSNDNIKMSTVDLTIHKRTKPFAQGAMRLAFHGRTAHSLNPSVVKSFKHGDKQLAHLVEEMQCQVFCKAFALEFNALVAKENSVDFIVTTSLKGMTEKGGEQRLSLEPFIEGEYVKYNNNCGFVNEELGTNATNQAAQAFSHFSFERSSGRFLISDLQGVGNVLTDPAIHTKDEARFPLIDTNLGVEGFKFFFATHECNHICRSLGLKTNADMLLKGAYTYRSSWPSVSSTVCCSNKLCGKIVRLESAHKVLTHPGFVWCDTCVPQLERTRLRRACIGLGPYHTFEVSAFFFESQGLMTPRTCPSHRTRDENVRPPSMSEVGGGGFFKKLGFGGKGK